MLIVSTCLGTEFFFNEISIVIRQSRNKNDTFFLKKPSGEAMEVKEKDFEKMLLKYYDENF